MIKFSTEVTMLEKGLWAFLPSVEFALSIREKFISVQFAFIKLWVIVELQVGGDNE